MVLRSTDLLTEMSITWEAKAADA